MNLSCHAHKNLRRFERLCVLCGGDLVLIFGFFFSHCTRRMCSAVTNTIQLCNRCLIFCYLIEKHPFRGVAVLRSVHDLQRCHSYLSLFAVPCPVLHCRCDRLGCTFFFFFVFSSRAAHLSWCPSVPCVLCAYSVRSRLLLIFAFAFLVQKGGNFCLCSKPNASLLSTIRTSPFLYPVEQSLDTGFSQRAKKKKKE